MAHGRSGEGMKPASPIHRGGPYLCSSVKPVAIQEKVAQDAILRHIFEGKG